MSYKQKQTHYDYIISSSISSTIKKKLKIKTHIIMKEKRKIERDIKKLEAQKKETTIALLAALFGCDMLYIEGSKALGKSILLWVLCCFGIGLIWVVMNLISINKRVDEYNDDIEDQIEELENKLAD